MPEGYAQRGGLRDADLTRADLSGAGLSGARLLGAQLADVRADDGTTWPAGFTAA